VLLRLLWGSTLVQCALLLAACQSNVDAYAHYVEDLAALAEQGHGDCEHILPALESYVRTHEQQIRQMGQRLSDPELRLLERRMEAPLGRFREQTSACREEADYVIALLFEPLTDN